MSTLSKRERVEFLNEPLIIFFKGEFRNSGEGAIGFNVGFDEIVEHRPTIPKVFRKIRHRKIPKRVRDDALVVVSTRRLSNVNIYWHS